MLTKEALAKLLSNKLITMSIFVLKQKERKIQETKKLPRNIPPIARFCFMPPNYTAARLEVLFKN